MLKIPSFLFGIIAISSSIILFSANSPLSLLFMLKILNTIIITNENNSFNFT